MPHSWPREVYVPETSGQPAGPDMAKGSGDAIAAEVSGLAATVAALVATIGTLVVAAVKIKILLLFVFIHPLLALLGAAVALLSFLGLGKATKEVVEARIKNYEFGTTSLWVLHRVLSQTKFQAKLAQGRAEAKTELQRTIRESTRRGAGQSATDVTVEEIAVEKFETVLGLVIQDLGVLELVGAATQT